MDYEKAYKAVLQTATQWIKDGCTDKERICLECVFPELRESEDERIRKEIIDFIQWAEDRGMTRHDYHQTKRPAVWLAYLEKQKEQKPDIELIQRSWYMEGYHDREFGKEPKWIIKTGEGGPKHELNPRYGQPLAEQKPVEWNGATINGEPIPTENQSVDIPLAEWSEEDEKMLHRVLRCLDPTLLRAKREEIELWLKSLHPSWKPSEEQMKELKLIINGKAVIRTDFIRTLYNDLKKL